MAITITDRQGQRHAVPENLTAVRNQDRYMRCTSCKATADVMLISQTATITQVSPFYETETKTVQVSACLRHIRINLARASKAQSITRTYDDETRRWTTTVN